MNTCEQSYTLTLIGGKANAKRTVRDQLGQALALKNFGTLPAWAQIVGNELLLTPGTQDVGQTAQIKADAVVVTDESCFTTVCWDITVIAEAQCVPVSLTGAPPALSAAPGETDIKTFSYVGTETVACAISPPVDGLSIVPVTAGVCELHYSPPASATPGQPIPYRVLVTNPCNSTGTAYNGTVQVLNPAVCDKPAAAVGLPIKATVSAQGGTQNIAIPFTNGPLTEQPSVTGQPGFVSVGSYGSLQANLQVSGAIALGTYTFNVTLTNKCGTTTVPVELTVDDSCPKGSINWPGTIDSGDCSQPAVVTFDSEGAALTPGVDRYRCFDQDVLASQVTITSANASCISVRQALPEESANPSQCVILRLAPGCTSGLTYFTATADNGCANGLPLNFQGTVGSTGGGGGGGGCTAAPSAPNGGQVAAAGGLVALTNGPVSIKANSVTPGVSVQPEGNDVRVTVTDANALPVDPNTNKPYYCVTLVNDCGETQVCGDFIGTPGGGGGGGCDAPNTDGVDTTVDGSKEIALNNGPLATDGATATTQGITASVQNGNLLITVTDINAVPTGDNGLYWCALVTNECGATADICGSVVNSGGGGGGGGNCPTYVSGPGTIGGSETATLLTNGPVSGATVVAAQAGTANAGVSLSPNGNGVTITTSNAPSGWVQIQLNNNPACLFSFTVVGGKTVGSGSEG